MFLCSCFYREVQNEMESVRRKLQGEIEDLNFSKSSLERQNVTLDGELTASRTEVAGLKSTVAELSSSQAKIISELESTKVCMWHISNHHCLFTRPALPAGLLVQLNSRAPYS